MLLFNWLGYRFVINYLQQRADQQLEARIDLNHYNDSQLIEIRVALNMPYQSINSSFERHYGEVEISGKHYTYVKRKIEDGFLVLKCLPNYQKDDLNNFKTTTQENGKTATPVKYATADFDNDKAFFQVDLPVVAGDLPLSFNTSSTTPGFISTAGQPPETV